MAEISKITKNVVFKEQIAKTVDFNQTKGGISYSSGGQFENFFREILTEEELSMFCRNCVEMIISRYGTKAYPIQHFEYEGFAFIAQYLDLGEDTKTSVFTMFWGEDEY